MVEIVIDASVVLKWYMTDEDYGEEALNLLDQHIGGKLSLVAPTILCYEIVNALLVAERMDRIAGQVTEKALSGFLELEIGFSDICTAYEDVLTLARFYQRSAYDASYLALAKRKGIDFVTGDKRLFNAVREELPWVKWIGG